MHLQIYMQVTPDDRSFAKRGCINLQMHPILMNSTLHWDQGTLVLANCWLLPSVCCWPIHPK
jgi:hypothetical protein